MGVLVTYKNEEDSTKNEGAQGPLTTKSVVESCRNSNPSKRLWLTMLPARMKKIHWKLKVLEWSQRFAHYKSIGIFSKRCKNK